MLREFIMNGYLTGDEICSILQRAESLPTFEENFKIQRDTKCYTRLGEFMIIHEKTPILRLSMSDGCFIDIVLRHKQRAVGYQAMVYIYIPINSEDLKPMSPNERLIGRPAH